VRVGGYAVGAVPWFRMEGKNGSTLYPMKAVLLTKAVLQNCAIQSKTRK
jgi:hypothetical protein